ncbi:MAG TPA: right-handed parallel beta-helix repeat-containing protein [Roseimicrobium sp.]|nr:right-handed parallel beta-helix repeat-containing protein [Roseimicrobium sp.]
MKSILLASLFAGCLCAATETLAQSPKPQTTARGVGAFEVRVPAPGPDALADKVLQEAIDTVVLAGGGVVLLGAGDFKLSRHAGDETVVIKSGVTLRGQGFSTHIYLDPTTPPNPLRYFPLRIGTGKVPASNVVIEQLRYTGHDKAIGGGSIMGLNARLDEPESLLLSCDNVSIRHCWIYDAKQAVGCTKPGGSMYEAKTVITPAEATAASKAGAGPKNYTSPDRLASQFKNWQVCHNFIDTCGNKAIELAECNGGLIADNYMTNVVDGPQVIFGSRNVQIRDNEVYFTRTGINITEGSNHIRVSGNHVEPVPTFTKNEANACLLFRTEPLPLVSTISHVVVTGNIFRDQTTQQKGTVKFVTRPESHGCTYEAITLTGNVFDGDVLMLDKRSPAMTTIRDVIFTDNICDGDLLSESDGVMKSSNVMVRGNQLRKPGNYSLQASGWIWSGNSHPGGSVTIASGAEGNVVHGNVVTSEIADQGTKTNLAGNVVMKKADTP